MPRQFIRHLLAPLAALVLLVGLAPPAAAGAGPSGPAPLSLTAGAAPPTALAGSPTAAPAAPPSPLPTVAEPSTSPADPAVEVLDVLSDVASDDGSGTGTIETAPTAGGTVAGPSGVDAEVNEALADDGSAPVIVRLTEQPDLAEVEQRAARAGHAAAAATHRELQGQASPTRRAQAAGDAERAARADVVVDSLQSTARASQGAVRELFATHQAEGHVDDVAEFWIFNGFAATVDEVALDALAGHPDVASVTLDETIVLDVPELTEVGEPKLPAWSLENINAPRAWGEYGARGEGVVVGVMDTGVDGAHPALTGAWRGADGDPAASWFVPTGENYPQPGDFSGHGTHVTGSILGAPPGEVIGVAPQAQWIAAKIFRDTLPNPTTTDSIVHAGFEWMLAPGGDPSAAPHVVNNSWGSTDTFRTEFWDDVAAWVAAGIVPVFSNGNAGPAAGTVGAPASFPHTIGVGATDVADRLAYFSSRGPVTWDGVEYTKPQVSAPGYEVLSSLPDGRYGLASGTSMAAPHATGVVSLMLSAAPGLSVDDVRAALAGSARGESHMAALPNGYGAGVIDAHAAVTHVAHSGVVSGTVTNGADGPVEATVAVDDQSVTSDAATGAYLLRLPAGSYDLTVSAYGYAPQTHEVTVTVGATVTLDMTLAGVGDHPVSGTVTGPDGPVPQARIEVADTPLTTSRTDTQGRFELTVAEGRYAVRVTAAGHAPRAVEAVVDGPTDLAVALDPLAGPVEPGWAQYQNNPARTGQSLDALPIETLEPSWTAAAGGAVTFSSPVIGDGRVYVSSDNGTLSAFDLTDGERVWTFDGSITMRGAPAVVDGVVYTGGGQDGGIHAVDAATGDLVWTVETPGRRTIYTTPTVVDGVVYVTTGFTPDDSDTVLALDAATGDEIWSVDIGSRVFFGPAVEDGVVVAASAGDQRLVALDAANGDELWSLHRDEDQFIAGPTIADGTVYITTTVPIPATLFPPPPFQGSVLAVEAATGDLVWEAETHGDGQGSTPAVHGDLVIAGSLGPGLVAAYDRATGDPVWHYGPDAGGVSVSTLVTGDGYLFGGSQIDARFWALDAATGELVWEHPADGNVLSSAAYAEGRLVVADRSGTLHSFHQSGDIAGTVTGPDGPVPATVRLRETGAETRADEQTGAFEFGGLAAGEYTLEFSQYGFAPVTRTTEVVAGGVSQVDVDLVPLGHGSLTGVVRDEAGEGLAGATVTLPGTPLDPVVTGDDGSYTFAEVAAGEWEVVADAAGYVPQPGTIQIAAGETAVADFTLERFDLAVVSDYEGMVTAGLRDAGWRADRVTFDEIAGTTDRYRAVVISGILGDRADEDLDRLARLVEEADQTGTSLVFLGQWTLTTGSVRALSLATGDPALVERENNNWADVWVEDVVEHPITASLPSGGERTVLMNDVRGQVWFSGYTGYPLARIGTDRTGQLGDSIGYQPRTWTSNHILLSVHAPHGSTHPENHWQPVVWDTILDAVDYAAGAEYGEVTGQATDAGGDPLAATVEVVDGVENTIAGDDGSYQLLLPPGEHTLRYRFLGAQTVQRQVTVTAGQTSTLDVSLPDLRLGVITGQVTEAGTDRPVAGATVTVPGLPEVTTNRDGQYLIEQVPAGSYQLTFGAEGYQELVVEDVEVSEGDLTTVDAGMSRLPAVAVVGDRNGEITNFLELNSVPAVEAGWEVTDDLDEVEVVVLNHPPNLDREEFLAALAAFDDAGVSVVFLAEGSRFRTRGIDLLVRHTGDPPSFDGIGGFNGPPIYLHDVADHPLFDGVEDDPVQLLTGRSEAGFFPEYSGVALADIAEEGAGVAGIGMAYNPRTPDSVHLLLGGLTATFRNSPVDNWTADGQRIFLNAMRWAAAPGLGAFSGTVTDAADQPIADATVNLVGTSWKAVTDADGGFEIAVPPGEYTLDYRGFGYAGAEQTLTVAADQRVNASVRLEIGAVGAITGTVTGDATALADVEVTLLGTPLRTTTDATGSFGFARVEPGGYRLEVEADGYVRTVVDVEVTVDQTTGRDVALRASPTIGVIGEFTVSGVERVTAFLTDWGYLAEEVDWDSLDRIAGLDLVIANIGSSGDPGAAGLDAFEEAVNRADVPVLWMGQNGVGAIRYLHNYHGDPAVRGQGGNDGTVSASVVADHPLVAGVPDAFELIAPDRRYGFFDEFGGTTVATLATGDDGELGATIAYRGRTTGTVDVLLSTMASSTWGFPSTRDQAARNWTPEAEQVLRNALEWALDAQGVGAEVLATVRSERDGLVASQVTVLETGRSYTGRDGDGTFLVPLQPGTWTLEVSAFGHEPQTLEVTLEAGDSARPTVTLAALPSGAVAGTAVGPDGEPVADAEVTLRGTPLAATTGTDGGYTVEHVPEGTWTLRVAADGYRAAHVPVTVVAGQTVPVDVQLKATAMVAITDVTGSSSFGTALADMIEEEGYQVELFSRSPTGMAELVTRVDEFDVVVFNPSPRTSQREAFGEAVDAVTDAGVSAIFASQFGGQAIGSLASHRGDPAEVDWGIADAGVDYVPNRVHPIFAGFPAGEPIELITSDLITNGQQWSTYAGWSGETIATLHARLDGEDQGAELGEAVGYRFSSPSSVEVLLSSLTATTHGMPGDRWTEHAERIYLNAVGWAIDARRAEVAGVVTGDGEPLAGASVTAVEAEATTLTSPDGSYNLGLEAGTYTIQVSAFGFETAEETVQVPESGTATRDFDLVPLPRGGVSGTVTSVGGEPVADATVAGTGPQDWTAMTGDGGEYMADGLLEGEYDVTVTADGFLPAETPVTISADHPVTLDVALQPMDVGVLGDADGALTAYLREADVLATVLEWDAELDLSRYEVVVVNGGDPAEATFDAVMAAADDAEVSLVFTGTWAVDRGGVRLLERYTDRVEVGAQGFGDGPVQLTGFDQDHPLFTGLADDPATLIVEGGYYSVLDEYAGQPLADLHVDREDDDPVTGLAVGWDWRTAGSVEILLSASAVTGAVGPGLGWTPDGGQLLLNAVEWAREAELEQPGAPTLAADAPVVVEETVTVSGKAEWPSEVTVQIDGAPAVTVETDRDGAWSAQVPLAVGDNVLTAVATNLAGDSPASQPVTVARWLPSWDVRGRGAARPVFLNLEGPPPLVEPADQATLVVHDDEGAEVVREQLRWTMVFYLHILHGLSDGEYQLSAELEVDGHLLVIDGPTIS